MLWHGVWHRLVTYVYILGPQWASSIDVCEVESSSLLLLPILHKL